MITVHKYRIALYEVSDTRNVSMPRGAELLHVGEQDGQVDVWARVDTEAEYVSRAFVLVGTGFELNAHAGRHVGTVQMRDGLVWHVFEVTR